MTGIGRPRRRDQLAGDPPCSTPRNDLVSAAQQRIGESQVHEPQQPPAEVTASSSAFAGRADRWRPSAIPDDVAHGVLLSCNLDRSLSLRHDAGCRYIALDGRGNRVRAVVCAFRDFSTAATGQAQKSTDLILSPCRCAASGLALALIPGRLRAVDCRVVAQGGCCSGPSKHGVCGSSDAVPLFVSLTGEDEKRGAHAATTATRQRTYRKGWKPWSSRAPS